MLAQPPRPVKEKENTMDQRPENDLPLTPSARTAYIQAGQENLPRSGMAGLSEKEKRRGNKVCKNGRRFFLKMDSNAKTDLTLEEMEYVIGGVITQKGALQLQRSIYLAKSAGISLNQLLSELPGWYARMRSYFPDATIGELESYIRQNW